MSRPTIALNHDPNLTEAERKRLTRLMVWCSGGRLAAAELELYGWSREADCPPTARVMLASLLCRRGETEQARRILRGGGQPPESPRTIQESQLLLATLMTDGLNDAAGRVARELHDRQGNDPAVSQWLKGMAAPGSDRLSEVAQVTADELAAELIEQPDVIPSLVYGLKLEPRAKSIELLRRAIGKAARHFEGKRQMVSVCLALAELSLLLGDDDDARRWAHRGLRLDVYNASLAMVLAKVPDDPGVGEPARAVLERVSQKHERYPDVRAALIRRDAADGHAERARMRIENWLAKEPDSPIAKDLAQELAA